MHACICTILIWTHILSGLSRTEEVKWPTIFCYVVFYYVVFDIFFFQTLPATVCRVFISSSAHCILPSGVGCSTRRFLWSPQLWLGKTLKHAFLGKTSILMDAVSCGEVSQLERLELVARCWWISMPPRWSQTDVEEGTVQMEMPMHWHACISWA